MGKEVVSKVLAQRWQHNQYLMRYTKRRYRIKRYRKYKLRRKHEIGESGIFTDTLKIFGKAWSRAWR